MAITPLPLLVALLICVAPRSANAHAVTNSYLELSRTEAGVSGRWRIAVADLEGALGLDDDGDGRVSPAELSSRSGALRSFAASRLELSAAGTHCPLHVGEPLASGADIAFELASPCEGGVLALRYDLFFEHDPSHQGHYRVTGASEVNGVFTHQRRTVELGAGAPTGLATFLQYVGQGVWHILIGLDHVLFVLTLLLTSLRGSEQDRREARARAPLGLSLAKVTTGFTVAHSITLSLAARGVATFPGRWVEPLIALSIAAAAANNLWPVVRRRVWALACVFGLVHGMGFANVLLEVGLPASRAAAALLGFNVGVELGQLGIIAAALPIVLASQRRAAAQAAVVRWGSVVVGAVGLFWAVERAFGAGGSAELALDPLPARAPRLACPAVPALGGAAHWDFAGTAGASTAARQRALALGCSGQLDASARAYAEVLRTAEGEDAASVRRAYAEVERARGDTGRAIELLEAAVLELRDAGSTRALADALAQLGEHSVQNARWARAHRAYDEARALHERQGATASLARDLARLGDTSAVVDPDRANEYYERAQAAYERLGDTSGVLAQLRNRALARRLAGDLTASAQLYRRAIELGERHGHEPELASDLAALARVYVATGQLDEAKALFERANAREQKLGRTRALAKNHNQLGQLHQRQGEPSRAEQMYQAALSLSESVRDRLEAGNQLANLAGLARQRGDLARARELYAQSLARFEESGSAAKERRVRRLLASLDAQPTER